MSRSQNQRSGYVLVMSLALISLSAVLLAGFARHSLQLAMEASRAQDDLQRRWGTVTCRQAILDRAEQILQEQAVTADGNSPPWPHPSTVSTTIRLGSLDFQILLSDEDAKVNLNAVYNQRQGRNTVTRLIQQLNGRLPRIPIELRPNRGNGSQATTSFASWGQVFALDRSPEDMRAPEALIVCTSEITCWGSGRLNVRRASDAAVKEVCVPVVQSRAVRRLLDMRKQPGNKSLDGMMRGLGLPGRQQSALRNVLTDQSGCHSLWLSISSDRRRWHTLLVGVGGRRGTRLSSFQW